jgi:large subunit ribosomal protein L13
MKIIDGKDAVLGRLASFVAKDLLIGEEIVILNCEQVIVTGNKKKIQKDFEKKRSKVGSGQQGPKISRSSEKIVKRAIRGMLPNPREGRGKEALKRIKCYNKVPKEYETVKKILAGRKPKVPNKGKILRVKEIFE